MARWVKFFSERFPFPVLLLVSGGLALSSLSLLPTPISWGSGLAAAGLSLLFFAVLRLMDEVKDYKKDLIAHPQRPLPRGLLSLAEARLGIRVGLGLMLAVALLSALLGYTSAGLYYFLTTVYLYLMYREFFVRSWLEKRVLIYTLSHQIILLLLGSSLMALHAPGHSVSVMSLAGGIVFLSAFLNYEICRKLAPNANPVLGTYRTLWGLKRTGLFLNVAALICCFGIFLSYGWTSQLGQILLASQLLLLALFYLFAERRYKLVEGFASAQLLLFLWAPTLIKILNS